MKFILTKMKIYCTHNNTRCLYFELLNVPSGNDQSKIAVNSLSAFEFFSRFSPLFASLTRPCTELQDHRYPNKSEANLVLSLELGNKYLPPSNLASFFMCHSYLSFSRRLNSARHITSRANPIYKLFVHFSLFQKFRQCV